MITSRIPKLTSTQPQPHPPQLDEDVLLEIFQIATHEEMEPSSLDSDLLHFPEILLLFNRRWKWVVESSPAWWTRIRCDEAHGVERLKRWLARSGEVGLHISWSWPARLHSESLELVRDQHRELVREHRNRLESFQVNPLASYSNIHMNVHHFLRGILYDTPALRSLQLNRSRWPPLPYHDAWGRAHWTHPGIVTFEVRDCYVTWLWSMENLRELRLESLQKMRGNLLFFYLRSSPRLEVVEVINCHLNRLHGESRGDEQIPALEMLHTLRVVESDGAYFVSHSLLEFLRAPNVVTLELDCSEPGPPTRALATFVLASKSTLRHLTLRAIDALEGGLLSFLESSFPHLQTLSLHSNTLEKPYEVTEEMLDLINRCPNLQSLVLVGVVFPSPTSLMRLVEDRRTSDDRVSLKKLCIYPWPGRSVKAALEMLGVECMDA